MPHLYLGLAIHNHQPVGNFDFVFADVYRQSYLPLVEVIERHPAIRLSLHYSGCLLDWLFANKPEFIRRLAALAARGQIELMTGGYYEPILPMIPDADKLGQISKLAGVLKERFGQQPTGLWLTERVWEPSLPSSLSQAGVEWTVVDDTHFRLVGIDEDQLRGSYLTEDQGQSLKVYGSSKQLRYIIPWRPVEEVIAYLREQADDVPGSIIVMGDDGEKFGSWPGTYEHCWEQGWVEQFFEAIEANSDWLTIVPIGEHAGRFPALGLVYLPSASYDEMMEWSLPAGAGAELGRLQHEAIDQGRDDLLRHLQGGFWRNFLRKYPEINAMHKRMLRTHRKVLATAPHDNREAQERLWSGQCNCAYWHGVFGGLYLNHIRAATHSNLIAAEAEADRLLHDDRPWLTWEEKDHNLDGRDEVLIQTRSLSLLVHPALGGMLSEWDLRRQRWHLLNVVSRRPEAYHESLLTERGDADLFDSESVTRTIHDGLRRKEANLQRHLVFDSYWRGGFQEHLLPLGIGVEDFAGARFSELGDFLVGEYKTEVEETPHGVHVRQRRHGWVESDAGHQLLRIVKGLAVEAEGESLRIDYEITNVSELPTRCLFVSEWNLNLPHHDATIRVNENSEQVMSLGELGPANHVHIEGGAGVVLQAQTTLPARLWRFPIETVSNSEGGLERSRQGVCLAFVLELALESAESVRWGLSWEA